MLLKMKQKIWKCVGDKNIVRTLERRISKAVKVVLKEMNRE
jgi:hypothetical protein